jgi:predicted DsbA family dithiol-disulfide isomerase
MEIEIWSDVVCPFCWLGKHRFEKALAAYPGKAEVEVTWRSFQLHPDMQRKPGMTLERYLTERKGWSFMQIRAGHERIAKAGAELGIRYDFDKAVVANSFDAHRLIQAAKAEGKGDAMEERLFRAYFGEGADIGDPAALAGLAVEAGMGQAQAASVLADPEAFADAVTGDIREAENLGINAVPFFVINRKFGVSGAQDPATFLRALEQAAAEVG